MQHKPIPCGIQVAMGANQPEFETLQLRMTFDPENQCPEFTGAFYPSPEELALLNAGHPLMLSMLFRWSPMRLEVSATPDGSDG